MALSKQNEFEMPKLLFQSTLFAISLGKLQKRKGKGNRIFYSPKEQKKKRKSNYKRNIQNCKVITIDENRTKRGIFDGLDNFVFVSQHVIMQNSEKMSL